MHNKRILITGGAGLIGSHIADQALQGGASEIVALDNFVRGRRENLASALAARAPVADEVFNVASGVETSLNDLAYALLRVMGSGLKPEYGPERKVNPVPRRLADTRAAREKIGFEARIPLEEGLRRLVAWKNACAAEPARA